MSSLKLLQRLLPIAALLCLPALAQAAADHAATEQVQVRLIPERSQAHPGATVLIGFEQKIIPHWHTYWQNPGDSGMATSIVWQLPAGASAGPIQWPLPQRYVLGSITNYGYADHVVLLSPVRIPADAKPGSDFPLTAKANWLVCQEVCIPQQAELGLRLKIVAPGTRLAAANPLIEAARATLPQDTRWPVRALADAQRLQLRVDMAGTASRADEAVWFYPSAWGRIVHGAAQAARMDGTTLIIDMQAGEQPLKPGEALDGVLVFGTTDSKGRGYSLHVVAAANAAAAADAPSASSAPDRLATRAGDANPSPSTPGLLWAMLLALGGGLILNLMPCVFPVLSIKALALVRHGPHADRGTRLQGVAYTGGVVLAFLVLAALLLLLRSGGAQIGWGFQFQSPGFVLGVAWLMFALGLSLSGVFALGNSVAGLGAGLADKPGLAGSFFTGVLATVVATPCTAPFMGVAIAYALSQPALQLVLVFASLGLGLALPYLLLSNWPLLQRALPKPGAWMETLKQVFAFPMYATALWLIWVLAQQSGPDGVLLALGGMLVIAFAAWLYGRTRTLSSGRRRSASAIALALVVAAATLATLRLPTTQVPAQAASENSYSEAKLQALRAEGKPVFLNFTAAWCITCLVNERAALGRPEVQDAFRAAGIHYLKGDWTNQDAAITAKLAEFGRNGVPLYVFYPPGKDAQPVVLPQLLTPAIVLEHIRPQP